MTARRFMEHVGRNTVRVDLDMVSVNNEKWPIDEARAIARAMLAAADAAEANDRDMRAEWAGAAGNK